MQIAKRIKAIIVLHVVKISLEVCSKKKEKIVIKYVLSTNQTDNKRKRISRENAKIRNKQIILMINKIQIIKNKIKVVMVITIKIQTIKILMIMIMVIILIIMIIQIKMIKMKKIKMIKI